MDFKDIPIGIDLGTTNSCIGAFRNGIVEIIPNQILERTTPSVVSFSGEEIAIGEQTKNQVFANPEKVIYSIKRIMGKKTDEADYNKLIYNLTYKNIIKPDEKKRPIINVNFKGQSYYPEEISAMILKRLKENAESYLKQKIKKVVITIPAYFTESQREATKIAGKGAGLEVIKIINEPTAAALAYGLGEKTDKKSSDDDDNFFLENTESPSEDNLDKKTILIFDLGGGTLDVTCLKIIKDKEGPQFKILGHCGNTHLGGDDFDDILVEYCIKKFNKKYKIPINNRNEEDIRARMRLKIACERAKKFLSSESETKIKIESLYNNKDLFLRIKRSKFEKKCKEKFLFEEMIKPIEDALKFSKLGKKDIDEIVLVGGSTRIPKVEETIKNFFGGKKKICKSINPDEVVAYGATLQAAISMKVEAVSNVLVNDVCSHSIGISIWKGKEKGLFDKLIENATHIPYEVESTYSTAYDNQKSVLIEIYEGENKYCQHNRLLGKFILTNITKAKKCVPQIKVNFRIDEDSILHVTAKESISGATNSLDIKYDKGAMQQDEIIKMQKKLENKKDFKENKIDEKEKELTKQKRLLMQNYKKTNNFDYLKKIEKIQEDLIDIIIKNFNKNDIDKRYNNVKFLFKLYNLLFTKKYNEYKKLSKEYLVKIKKYMDVFKKDDLTYVKSLLYIFKDDNHAERISQIVYHCINLYKEILKKLKNEKFSLYYIEDILDLITSFRNKIKESSLKKEFSSIEKSLEVEKDTIKAKLDPRLIESEDKTKNTKKILTNEEALSAIDQYTYIIDKYGIPNKNNTPIKEKELRAYILAKLVYLELNFLNHRDFEKLKERAEESLSLANDCDLKKETDPWVSNLIEMKKKITKEINEQKNNKTREFNKKLDEMIERDIDGNNDKENIEFLKMLDSELIRDSKKKDNIEEMYKKNGEYLVKRRLSVINKIPAGSEEIKNKKNKLQKMLEKIQKYILKIKEK